MIALLLSCSDDKPYDGTFDQPLAAAILADGPFDEPVGYVANGVGGRIIPLGLKSGRFLTLDPTGSFVPGHGLPTGRNRGLSGAVAVSDGVSVNVYASDRHFRQILRVPHVTSAGPDGPVEWTDENPLLASPPTFVDADASGGLATLVGLQLRDGWTSTEDWTVTYDGEEWLVSGSRSGPQGETAVTGRTYVADERALTFSIFGAATAGDRFEFSTTNGIEELDIDGIPTHMVASADGAYVAVLIEDDLLGQSRLDWFDPNTFALAPSALPSYAAPSGLAFDEGGAILWVSDRDAPLLYEVPVDGSSPIVHSLPWAVGEVAQLTDTNGASTLFLAPIGTGEVWRYDPEGHRVLDVDLTTPGDQGMDVGSTVIGLSAVQVPYTTALPNDDGDRPIRRSVAVSTFAGRVVFIEERTGCLVSDRFGPRTAINEQYSSYLDYISSYDGDVDFGPYLEPDAASGHCAIVNSCAGLAPSETWRLTFDRNAQRWDVDGSVSGEMLTSAAEDERYLSDGGEISFVVRAGAQPSQDGMVITLRVDEGAVSVVGDNDLDGIREVNLDTPSRPYAFSYIAGEGEGTERAMVLILGSSGDIVGRIDPQDGVVEASWF